MTNAERLRRYRRRLGKAPSAQTVAKQARRAAREAELGARIQALPDRRYGIIVADPPWRFEPRSRVTGLGRSAANHYPTSLLEEIKALDVPSIAASDCILFLWATVPMLPQALDVMAAWGFAYRTHFVWLKDKIGLGYWARSQHELLLVGTRGEVPAPAVGAQPISVIAAPRREHSRKPEEAYALIEAHYPTFAKDRAPRSRRGSRRLGRMGRRGRVTRHG
jgi:N6-adenosine-specific RNA methylase IME4